MFFAKQGEEFNIQSAQKNNDNKDFYNLPQQRNKNINYNPNNNNQTPKPPMSDKNLNRKASRDKLQQQNSSIFNQAAQNLVSNTPRSNSRNRVQSSNVYNQRDILDDEMSKKIVKDLYKEGGVADNLFKKPPRISNSPSPIVPNLSSQQSGKNLPKRSSDGDMVAMMSQRLSKVEKLCHSLKMELKEKNDKIISLENEVDCYKKADTKHFKIEYEKLKKENLKQKQQINDMEMFLNEYGLKWKGYNDNKKQKLSKDNQEKIAELKQQLNMLSDPKYKYNLPSEIDINIILKRIDDLNYVMEKEGVQQVVKDKQGIHQFQRMDPLPIGFYANGIALKGFPFFQYGSNQASQILADILDGYFPYQLKNRFPNGTLLRVIDKTDQKYTTDKVDQKFGDISGKNDNDNELKPLSKDEFLNKLPKQVVKNGKVIDVRDEIAKKFEPNNQIETKEVQEQIKQKEKRAELFKHEMEDERTYIPLTEEQDMFKNDKLSEQQKLDLCQLKIRTESGKYIILLRLFQQKSIQEVYNIAKYFSETSDFQIVDNATRQAINKFSQQTLEELDLHPNAFLNLQKLPQDQ